MKKYFSLIAVAVATMAFSSVFTSCSKDDAGSSYNPQVEAQDSTSSRNVSVTHELSATISNDALDLYDVNTVRTFKSQSVTYDYSESAMVYDYDMEKDRCAGKKCATDIVKVTDTKDHISIVTTVTLKSNWKEILTQKGGNIELAYSADFNAQKSDHMDCENVFENRSDADIQDALNTFGQNMAKGLSVE